MRHACVGVRRFLWNIALSARRPLQAPVEEKAAGVADSGEAGELPVTVTPPADDYDVVDGGEVEAGEWSMRINLIEAKGLVPVDETDTPDPKLKLRLAGLPCDDLLWEDTKQGQKNSSDVFLNSTAVFEFALSAPRPQDQLEMATLTVEVWDENFLQDDLLGSWTTDLTEVWNRRDHQLFRKWVGLIDVTGAQPGARGYVKLTATLIPPGAVPPANDAAAVAAADRAAFAPMMPPATAITPYELIVELHRAEDLPEMDSGVAGAQCDAYGKVEFMGIAAESQVMKSQSPDWTTFPTHPGVPEIIKLGFGMPEGGKLSSNVVTVSVWDRDELSPDDVVGFARLDMRKIRENPKKWSRPFWVYFYGAPQELSAGQSLGSLLGKFGSWFKNDTAPQPSTEDDLLQLQKLMNLGKVDGCLYRGRALIAASIHPKGEQPAYVWKPNPSEVEWLLCVELYEACDLPFETDPKIVITVGPHRAETLELVKSESSNGRAQWFQTTYMKLRFPDDLEQVPQIFVNLYKGEERTSFVKFTPKSIRGFEDMTPTWEELHRDPFGPLSKSHYAGTLLMGIGFGRSTELKKDKQQVLVQEAKTKATERQTAVFKTEEKLLLAKHIAAFAQGDSSKQTMAELKQAIQPTLSAIEGDKPRENFFWLDNIEQIVEQVPPSKLRNSQLLEAIKLRLTSESQRATRSAERVSSGQEVSKSDPSHPKMRARLEEVKQLVENLKDSEGDSGKGEEKDSFLYVRDYEPLWNDDKSKAKDDASIWRPLVKDKLFRPCGDVVSDGRKAPVFATVAVLNEPRFAKPPDDYKLYWNPKKAGVDKQDLYLWEPQAPTGYVALGLVVTLGRDKPKTEDYLCVHEDWLLPGRFDPHNLEKGWCTDGCEFDMGASLWTVPGINTFWAKTVRPAGNPDWDSRPTAPSRIRMIDPKKLPGKPTTQISSYSKVGMLECRSAQSESLSFLPTKLAGLVSEAVVSSGDGGQWETSWYALSGEALVQFSSKSACERYRVPNRVIFTNANTSLNADKVQSVGPMKEGGFSMVVAKRDGGEEVLTFRFRDRPAEAEAWQDVLSRCVGMWKQSVGSRSKQAATKTALELKQLVDACHIQFEMEDPDDMLMLWSSDGSPARDTLSIWRPGCSADAHGGVDVLWFGDFAHCGLQRPGGGVIVATLGRQEEELLEEQAGRFPFRRPDEFKPVGSQKLPRGKWAGLWLWQPICIEEPDFVCVGVVATTSEERPKPNDPAFHKLRCVSKELLDPSQPGQVYEKIWDNLSLEAVFFRKDPSLQLFDAPGPLTTFFASQSRRQPPHTAVHSIKSFLVPQNAVDASFLFLPMEEYKQRYIRLDGVPKMKTTSDLIAELDHVIQDAPLHVVRVEIDPAPDTAIVTSARAYFESTRPGLTEQEKEDAWKTLDDELSAQSRFVPGNGKPQQEEGLIFDCSYELRVHVYQGRGLSAADDDGLADPYVKASCAGEWAKRDPAAKLDPTGGSKLDQTTVVPGTVNPQWYETLYFRGPSALKGLPRPNQKDEKDENGNLKTRCIWPRLTLHVFDKDDWGKDDFLGRVSVSLDDIKDHMYRCTTPRWFKVLRANAMVPVGELLCSFQLIPLAVSSDEELRKLSRVDLRQHCQRAKLHIESFPTPELWDRQLMVDEIRAQVLDQKIVMPNAKECTVEVLVLGCRDLSGDAKSPFVEVDIGDPANKGMKVQSKPSRLPDTANPNFGEVLKLNIRLPEDPLFVPTVSVRVKDRTRSGDEIIGACSIDLVQFMPRWEAVAAAYITKIRRGQLKRRWLTQMLAARKVQKMWRAKQFKIQWNAAMREARRAQGLPEEEPLLPTRSRSSRTDTAGTKKTQAKSRGKSRRRGDASQRDISPVVQAAPIGPRVTEWVTKEPRVRRYKKRKNAEGIVEVKPEDTPTKTYHQIDSIAGEITGDTVLEPQRPPVGHPHRHKESTLWPEKSIPGDAAPRFQWQWDSNNVGSRRLEYSQELEEVPSTVGSSLRYPAMFHRYPLFVGDALKGSVQQVGFLKAIVRIVDHSPPTITASQDSSSSGNALLHVEGSDDPEMPEVAAEKGDKIDEVIGLFPIRQGKHATATSGKWNVRILGQEIQWNPREGMNEKCVPRGSVPSWNEDKYDLDLISGWRFGYNHSALERAAKSPVARSVMDRFVARLMAHAEPEPELLPGRQGTVRVADGDAEWADEIDTSDEEYVEPDPSPPGKLEVTVIKAVNLRDMELIGSMDPYIKVSLVETEAVIKQSMPDASESELKDALDSCVKTTRVIKDGGASEINFGSEKLVLEVDNEAKTLRIEAYDEEDWKSDDFIGRYDFNLEHDRLGPLYASETGDPRFKGRWPNNRNPHPGVDGGMIRLFSDKAGRRHAGDVYLQMEFKMQETDDRPLPPLGAELKKRSWRLVHNEIARQWAALRSAIVPDLIEVSDTVVVDKVWGSFQTSQVLLRDVSERLGLDDIEGHWNHLWNKDPYDKHGCSTRPSVTWLYPAGAWIMCSGYEVAIPAGAWNPQQPYSSPKNWLLLGGFRDGPDVDPNNPGLQEWDVLSRITDEKFRNPPGGWRDSNDNEVSLAKVKKFKNVDHSAAYKARFVIAAPKADELELESTELLQRLDGDETVDATVTLNRLSGATIDKRPVIFTSCCEADLPAAQLAKKKNWGDNKREETMLGAIIEHIISKEPAKSYKKTAPRAQKAGLEFLDPQVRSSRSIQLPVLKELIVALVLTADPRLPETRIRPGDEPYANIRKTGSYTCKMCVQEQNGRTLHDYVDGQFTEAQKRVLVGSEGLDETNAIKLLSVLQQLFANMPDLWFCVMGLLSFAHSNEDANDKKRILRNVILPSGTSVDAAGKAPRDAGALLFTAGNDPQTNGELSPLLRKYWYIEKKDYSTVRDSLRRSFSGEIIREVEAEYFKDTDRMAQGIVLDLASMVMQEGDKIRETFGNAKWLIQRNPDARHDGKPLTAEEVKKVFMLLGISMRNKDADGSVLFGAVMKILDSDGDNQLSYDEFYDKVTKTSHWVERNMGKISYLEVRELLQVLDDRLRNKKYRFFKLIVTQVTHPSKASVRLVGMQLHKRAAPWISQHDGITTDDPAATLDEDLTLKLLQPQDVVVRSYLISAEGLMPKDDNGLADPYVVTTLGSMEQGSEKQKRRSLDPYFGECHEFNTKLPGASQLKMTVYDDDLFGRDIMGATTVDLEDLWFCDAWRWSGRHGFKPIEKRTLLLPSKRASQGELRMWVDIIKRNECSAHPKIDICKPPGIPFELRVVVWSAERLPAMDRATDQNDAFITAELVGTLDDTSGTDILLRQESDVHWRCKASDTRGSACPPQCPQGCCSSKSDGGMTCCQRLKCICAFLRCDCFYRKNEQTAARTNAEWNWRFKFDVELPMKDCRFYLKAWDRDVLNLSGEGGDLIGGHCDTENAAGRTEVALSSGKTASDIVGGQNHGFDTMMSMFDEAESSFRRWDKQQTYLKNLKLRRPLTETEEEDLKVRVQMSSACVVHFVPLGWMV